MRKLYLIAGCVFAAVAAIGLVSLLGGMKPVNLGVFIFPTLIAAWMFYRYGKTKK